MADKRNLSFFEKLVFTGLGLAISAHLSYQSRQQLEEIAQKLQEYAEAHPERPQHLLEAAQDAVHKGFLIAPELQMLRQLHLSNKAAWAIIAKAWQSNSEDDQEEQSEESQ